MTTLAACGGGGGDDQPGLFFGSTDPAASRSGLDYADGTQNLTDLEGQTHTVRVVRVVTNKVTGVVEQIISNETLTLTPSGDGEEFTITLDGETLTFVDEVAERADGTFLTQSDPSDSPSLNHAILYELFASPEDGGPEDELTQANFVTGFETSPDAAALTTGTVFYEGEFDGGGNSGSQGNEFEGDFILVADFGTSTISGDVTLTSFDTAFGRSTVEFDLAQTAITGNGFAGDLTLTSCSIGTCTSDAEIGGVFYGPNAEEVAGLIFVDVTATNDAGETDQVSGTAAFGGAQVQPCARCN